MAPTDIPVAPTPPTTEIYPRSTDEAKKASFWISQLFILLATVVGVYLASSQGFKQALAYGEVQSARSNYYLRKSLRNEIADNITILEKYMDSIKGGSPSAREAPLNLDTFVMDCLKNSPNTLETPSELLRETRAFYRGVAEVQEKIANQTFAVGYGNQQLEALKNRMQQEVLPEFDKDLSGLQKRLAESGINVK